MSSNTPPPPPAPRRPTFHFSLFTFLCATLLVGCALALFWGRYPALGFLSPAALADDPLAASLVWNLRLPRVLAALLLGAALSGAGHVMQMLFRNPLVEPGFLGVSQGAALGAAAAILFLGGSLFAIQTAAALGAVLGLLLSWTLARRLRFGGWTLRLLLAGIAVSAFFSAAIGLLKALADPLKQLPDLTFWLMGGLYNVHAPALLRFLPLLLPSLLILHLMRWRLALLSLGDDSARALGVRAAAERTLLLAAAAAAVASVVALAGMVGWIGLLVPHLARRLSRAHPASSMPVAMALGALFALACDTLARSAPAEIPLGILTSFLGAALFLAIMTRAPAGATSP